MLVLMNQLLRYAVGIRPYLIRISDVCVNGKEASDEFYCDMNTNITNIRYNRLQLTISTQSLPYSNTNITNIRYNRLQLTISAQSLPLI